MDEAMEVTVDVLVNFIKYLQHEESIQGTVDEDSLLREYAREFLNSCTCE